MLFQGLSNNDVHLLPILKLQRFISHFSSPIAYVGQRVSSTLWHCILGHPTHSIVAAALSKSHISFPCNSQFHTCKACLQGKFTKLPFPVIASKSSTPFKVIHTNVWVPSPSMSIESYKYYVSFIDECTRYTWNFQWNKKVAVSTVFVNFLTFVSNYFVAYVKILQSDGGGEYISTQFKQLLFTKGIAHQKSCS